MDDVKPLPPLRELDPDNMTARGFLEEYVRQAVRTESQNVHTELVPPQALASLAVWVQLVGDAADGVKRSLFYGQPYDPEKLRMRTALNATYKPANLPVIVGADEARQLHAALGMVTEAVEYFEAVVSMLTAQDATGKADVVNAVEEIGDQNWYQAIAASALGVCLADAFVANNRKLRKRFPDRFTSDAAVHRDLAAERGVLSETLAEQTPGADVPVG